MARKHTVDEVLRALRQKNDVRVVDNYCLEILSDKVWDKKTREFVPNPRRRNDIGNGTWGKIDFLRKYHGYWIYRTPVFSNS